MKKIIILIILSLVLTANSAFAGNDFVYKGHYYYHGKAFRNTFADLYEYGGNGKGFSTSGNKGRYKYLITIQVFPDLDPNITISILLHNLTLFNKKANEIGRIARSRTTQQGVENRYKEWYFNKYGNHKCPNNADCPQYNYVFTRVSTFLSFIKKYYNREK
ncbi:MAG: hypothetical protein ACYCT6_08890 [bacterium]